MNTTKRIALLAVLAALAATGLQAQPATKGGGKSGQNSGGTTTGGTTTGGTTSGGTGAGATGGSTTDPNGLAKGQEKGNPTPGVPQGNANGQNNGNQTPGVPQGNATGQNATGQNAVNDPVTPGNSGNAGNAKGKDKEKTKGPNENASQNAKDVHAILDQFRTQRETYLAERKALLEKLKSSNDAEKKEILDKLKSEAAAREEEERALGKQIRDDLKKLRESRKSGGE